MLESPLVDKLIDLALEEDLPGGDVTADLTVPPASFGTARILVKEPMVLCGLPIVPRVLARRGTGCTFSAEASDGDRVAAGTFVGTLTGTVRELLALERTVLNFLQRLSGIATYTSSLVAEAGSVTLLDTRKTTPGWRVLEKYAVRTGGARNHRFSLSDMILVKNNHIDANGGDVDKTLARVMAEKPWYMPVEVEVRSEAELEAALRHGPNIVMLDNMTNDQIRAALAIVAQRSPGTLVEVSGGITKERFAELNALGVPALSTSALCGRARTVDISMRLSPARS